MKRRILMMDPQEFKKLKYKGAEVNCNHGIPIELCKELAELLHGHGIHIEQALCGSLVERNTEPQGTLLMNPFAVAKCDSTDLVELAREIQRADVTLRATACSKLQMIAEQMQFLQQQAHRILLEAKQNSKLHHAACNFRKLPGHIYYLYERPSGQQYFSMLSPEDWYSSHSGPPHIYVGAYRLEHDLSWTPEVSIAIRSKQMSLVDNLFSDEDTKLIKLSDLDCKAFDIDMQ